MKNKKCFNKCYKKIFKQMNKCFKQSILLTFDWNVASAKCITIDKLINNLRSLGYITEHLNSI